MQIATACMEYLVSGTWLHTHPHSPLVQFAVRGRNRAQRNNFLIVSIRTEEPDR